MLATIALRGSSLAQNLAGAALGHVQFALDAPNKAPTTLWAQKFPSAAISRMLLSRESSATSRLSWAFSFSSVLRRFA